MSAHDANSNKSVEMPAPTAWPLVVSIGIALTFAGMALSLGFMIVGIVVFLFGLGGWIGQLLPGQGRMDEELVEPSLRAAAPTPAPGTVDELRPGTAGFRFRLPEHVHPISAGAKGGIVGGILMAIPAMAYGNLAHESPWLPINLLAGVVVPGITDASLENLRQFHGSAFLLAVVIHFAFSITFGLMYGVILPMLPSFRGSPLLFGGILMPILWSGVCYGLMGVVNPLLQQHVNWPWFILSQFVYGLAMSFVVFRSEKVAVAQTVPLKSGT
jgi:hypothetical protein